MLKKLNRTDRILTAVALLGLLLFSGLLLEDFLFPKKENTENLRKVGFINTAGSDIRRKTEISFIWNDIFDSQSVYAGDSIYTGPSSQAKLNLNWKGEFIVDVKENSLITLRFIDDMPALLLDFGKMSAELPENTKVTLRLNNKRITLESIHKSKFAFNNKTSGATQVKVLEGDLRITNEDSKETVDLKKNEITTLDEKGSTNKNSEFHFLSDSSYENKIKWQNEGEKDFFSLSWDSEGSYDHFSVQLSETADFKKPVLQLDTNEAELHLQKKLAVKKYFWKVSAFDSNKQLIATSKDYSIIVKNILAPTVLAKSPIYVFSDSPESLKNAMLAWKSNDDAPAFKLQISSTSDFSKLTLEKEVSATSIQCPPLNEGTFYFRVASAGPQRPMSNFSNVGKIEIKGNSIDETLEIPTLVATKIEFDPTKKTKGAKPHPVISFKTKKVFPGYAFEISELEDFSTLISSDIIKSTNFNWLSFKPGTFFFRVRSVSVENMRSLPSSTGTLVTKANPPSINVAGTITGVGSTWDDLGQSKQTLVKWTAVANTKAYRLELSKLQDFTSSKVFTAPSNSYNLTIPEEGQYFVRVTPLGTSGVALSSPSAISKIYYTLKKPVKTPDLIEPKDSMTFFLPPNDNPFIWLTWSPSPNANSYEIQVAEDEDFSTSLLNLTSQNPKVLLQNKLPDGIAYWRVRAFNRSANSFSAWSVVRSFAITPITANEDGDE